jgi:hypothetical protein
MSTVIEGAGLPSCLFSMTLPGISGADTIEFCGR